MEVSRKPLVVRHVWARGSHITADAEAVAKQFAELTKRDGGVLTLDAVLVANAPEDAPLHNMIEWDDEIAAHEYRLNQAGHIVSSIRRVTVSMSKEEELPSERVYIPRRLVSTPEDWAESARTYVTLAVAQSDDEQIQRMRNRAFDRVERLVKEFASIEELADFAGELSDILMKYR